MFITYARKIEKLIISLNKLAHTISIFVVFFMMFLTSFDVLGRYFWKPILGSYELTGLSLAVMVFFSLGYTQIKKGHVTIDFLVDKWPSKIRLIIETIVSLLALIIILLTAWHLGLYAERLHLGGDVTGELRIPVYIFVYTAMVGLILYLLVLSVDLAKSIYRLVKKNES